MKERISLFILFLILSVFFFGKEIFYNYLLKRDEVLETKVILESDYENLKKEYDMLLEKVDLFDLSPQDTILSKVILKDPYYFFDTITILKGSEDDVEEGDIVYNEIGYIGKVKKVNLHSSEVELLTNRDSLISVQIKNSYGILKNDGANLVVKNITSKEELKEGDVVRTSSYSKIGVEIPIAVVEKVEVNMVEQILIVKPLVLVEDLNYVLIRKKVTNE